MRPTTTLYRPVGLKEMALILKSGLTHFPPRLPEQPIFYPVLNRAYAQQIAAEWNTKDPRSGYVGFVTQFEIPQAYADSFAIQTVGNQTHQELWVPATALADFNAQINPPILVIDAFYGAAYAGPPPTTPTLQGLAPAQQLVRLTTLAAQEPELFQTTILQDWQTIFLNYPYWQTHEFEPATISHNQKQETLAHIAAAWPTAAPIPPWESSGRPSPGG